MSFTTINSDAEALATAAQAAFASPSQSAMAGVVEDREALFNALRTEYKSSPVYDAALAATGAGDEGVIIGHVTSTLQGILERLTGLQILVGQLNGTWLPADANNFVFESTGAYLEAGDSTGVADAFDARSDAAVTEIAALEAAWGL